MQHPELLLELNAERVTLMSMTHPLLGTLIVVVCITGALRSAMAKGDSAKTVAPVPASVPVAPSLAWWQEAKFGLFLHWGLYSVTAGDWKGHPAKGNEHFMIHEHVGINEYAGIARQLNPVKYDAEQWVLTAKNAGMKYIVITSKHHEGFAMFNSPSSDYNIVKASPYGKDPMVSLAEACRKHGVVLCFYYSLGRDWEDPDVPTNWPTKGGRSNLVDFPDEDKKVFARYFERKVKPQIRELLTQYGPIGVLWFDTPELIPANESRELRQLIHELQPRCLVNERIGNRMGDFAISEQSLDKQGTTRPWESCITLSGGWGYNRHDTKWKSPEVVLRNFIEVASKGGNFLLNVGPTGEGEFPVPAVERLAAIGRWMAVNGEALYGSHAWRVTGEDPPKPASSPTSKVKPESGDTMKDTLNDVTPQTTPADLRFTAKGDAVYIFARSWREPTVVVKTMAKEHGAIKSVTLLGSTSPVQWNQDDTALTITLPAGFHPEIPILTFNVQ